MAVPSRKNRSVANGWNAINKQRDDEAKKASEEFDKKNSQISKDEEEKRIKMLRNLGLVK